MSIKSGTRTTRNVDQGILTYTFFSDNDSRAWDGVSVDKSSYNSLPEHFETFHYHAATYAISNGPFSFKLKTPDTGNNKDGQLTLASAPLIPVVWE